LIARERGIKVVETKSSANTDFATLISVEVETDKLKSSISGTLFGKKELRIVLIDGYYVDAVPSGYMIITSNEDKPGIIGQIGTLLGKNGINIAGMTFGRKKKQGQAISVINVDSVVSDKILEKIRSLDYINSAKLVKL